MNIASRRVGQLVGLFVIPLLISPTAGAEPSYSPNEIAYLKALKATGANPSSNQTAVNFGYNICSDIRSGTPESVLIEAFSGYTDAEMQMPQRPPKPTEAQAQQIIHAAIGYLCPNAR